MVNERWPRGDPGWRFERERERERGRIEIFVAQCISSRSMFFFSLRDFSPRRKGIFFTAVSRARAGFSRFTVVDSVEIWNGLCKRGLEIKNSKSWLSKTGVSINTPRIHTSSPSLKDGD